jgi:putative MATE family efflux protein
MGSRYTKQELLGSAPIRKALLSMGLPTMIGMMINALYNLVDAYFVGGLGTSQVGAISVTLPIGQVVTGIGLLFGTGAASCISRLLGRGKREVADKVASTALYCSLAVGIAAIALALVFLRPLLLLLGATKGILPYALTYARICLASSAFSLFNVTMNGIVTSEGSPRTTMYALLAGAVLNVILDPVFIYTLRLGIAGAAIATAISQFASTAIYLSYILGKRSSFSFKPGECSLERGILSEIFKTGVPVLLFQLLTSMSIMLVNVRSRGYGDSVIAGIGVVTRIMMMGSLVVFGFIKGFQPIAGYSYGAGNHGRLREAIRCSLWWSTLFCIAFGAIMIIFPSTIISWFTKGDSGMMDIGRKALRANGETFLFFGFYSVYSALFLALGKAREGAILGTCRNGICFVPAIALMPLLFGTTGIAYSQPVADILSIAVTIVMALRLERELTTMESKAGNAMPALYPAASFQQGNQ